MLKSISKLVICGILACNVMTVTYAKENISIDSYNFPDKGLREFISAKVDKDSDGFLSESEIEMTRSLRISQQGVKSLKGLNILTNIVSLEINNEPNLKTINLLNVPNLETLNIGSTGIKELTGLDKLNLTNLFLAPELLFKVDFDKVKAKNVAANWSYPILPLEEFDLKYINQYWEPSRITVKSGATKKGSILKDYYKQGVNTVPIKLSYDSVLNGKMEVNIQFINQTKVPANVSAVSNSYNSIKIEWDVASLSDGVQLYRATSENGKYYRIKNYPDTNVLICDGLSTNKKYWFKIRSYTNINGFVIKSKFADAVFATPKLSKPDLKIAGVASSNDGNGNVGASIILAWNEIDGSQRYQIYRKKGNGVWERIYTLKNETKKQVSMKSNYQFKVRACRKVNGEWKYSSFSNVLYRK